jgi:uncharacterized membrane protein (DUF485 family)
MDKEKVILKVVSYLLGFFCCITLTPFQMWLHNNYLANHIFWNILFACSQFALGFALIGYGRRYE